MELFIICLIYIGILIYLANIQDLTQQRSPWVTLMMMGLPLITLYLGVGAAMLIADPLVSLLFAAISIAIGIFGFTLIHNDRVRSSIAAITAIKVAPQPIEGDAAIGGEKRKVTRFKPDSAVHTAALLLALLMIVYNMSTFAFVGGTSGVAEAIESDTPAVLSALTNGALNLFVALLGVGLFIRRNERETITRLGLRWPTARDILSGLAGAVVMVMAVYATTTLMSLVIPADVLEEQFAATEAMNAPMMASLMVALISGILYGITEEILYRGALQPVFGLLPTAILFALVHLQYLFTPAMGIIFVVGLTLGFLRQRFSTTASIVAHSAYNILPFVLAIALGGNA